MNPAIKKPHYNKDPIILHNIWKPSRIKVKYVDFDGPNVQFTIYNFFCAISQWFPSGVTVTSEF